MIISDCNETSKVAYASRHIKARDLGWITLVVLSVTIGWSKSVEGIFVVEVLSVIPRPVQKGQANMSCHLENAAPLQDVCADNARLCVCLSLTKLCVRKPLLLFIGLVNVIPKKVEQT